MDPPYTALVIMLHLLRMFTLLVGLAFAYMGYRLFMHGVFDKAGELETAWGSKRLILKQAAPGTFFSLLGTIVIVVSLWKGVRLDFSVPVASSDNANIQGGTNSDHVGTSPASAKISVRPEGAEPLQSPWPLIDNSKAYVSESVIGSDPRIRITMTTEAPYAAVCHLEAFHGDDEEFGISGTGFLIAPRVVLTTAMFLHNHNEPPPTSIRVSPGRNGKEQPFGSITSTDYRVTDAWKSKEDANDNFGVIILSTSQRQDLPTLPLEPVTKDSVGGGAMMVGFPADKPMGTPWAMNGRVTPCSAGFLHCTMSLGTGTDGSVVLRQNGNALTVVGIVTLSDERGPTAIAITDRIRLQIDAWLQDVKNVDTNGENESEQ